MPSAGEEKYLVFEWDWHIFTESLIAYGSIGLLIVASAESSFFPIPPDVFLIGLAVHRPQLAFWYAALATGGSVIGGLFGYFLGVAAGRPLLYKLVSQHRLRKIERLFATYGGWAVAVAGFTPIPYKVFTIASGIFRIRKRVFLVASVISRGTRFFLEALVILAAGAKAQDFLARYFELITLGLVLVVAAGYVLVRRTSLVDLVLNIRALSTAGLDKLGFYRLAELVRTTPVLAAALLGACLSFLIFASLAEDLVENEIEPFDFAVAQGLVALHHPVLTHSMKMITGLGLPGAMTFIAAGFGIYLIFTKKRASDVLFLILVLVSSGLTTDILKNLFQRARPELWPLVNAPGYSFPSGHALMSTAFYGFLAYLLLRDCRSPVIRYFFLSLVALLVLAIGFSRVYLGVHYASDVLAGFAAGGFLLSVSILCFELLQRPGDTV